jgi:hypothetical protein
MRKYILFVIVSVAFITLKAQQEFTSYYMDALPQTSYLNPAKKFNGKFFIGLPGLSSTYLMYSNSSFAWSDVIQKNNDSLVFNMSNLVSSLSPSNYMSFAAQTDLLSFGFRIGDRTSVSFNVSEKFRFKFLYPKDFMKFIDEGNTGFENNTAKFDGMGINMTHFREYGVAFNQSLLDDRLVVGARFKYLYGMENIDSKKFEVQVFTDPTTYEMQASGSVIINSSGLSDSMDIGQDYLLNRKNTGFGLDLGATFALNEKIELNVSVVDLGFINWEHDVKNYVNDGSTFNFSGIDIDDFILKKNVDSSDNSSLQRVLDSLGDAFSLEEKSEAYRSNLIAQIYIGGSYQLYEKGKAGVLIQNEYFKGKLNPSLTLSYNHKFNKWFHATASYTVINNSYNNVGGGIMVHPGPVQLYVVADNILGAIQPQNARHMQVRAGINLVFGKGKINDVSRREKRKSEEIIEEELIPTTQPAEEFIPKTKDTEQPIEEELENTPKTDSTIEDSIPEPQQTMPFENGDSIQEESITPNNSETDILLNEADSPANDSLAPSNEEVIEENSAEEIIEPSSETQESLPLEEGETMQEENSSPNNAEIPSDELKEPSNENTPSTEEIKEETEEGSEEPTPE